MTETKMQLEDWLDDLCVRFIINLPREELESVERICFQVEEAQWFYEDFIRPLDPALPSLSLRAFALRIFQHCPLMSQWSHYHHITAFSEFLAYKTRVPVRGAILLNQDMDEVVLVKGWKKGANWSFPRGKINKGEKDLDCAIREVYEETGFDVRAANLVPEEDDVKYIEISMREQHMRLYVFRGVSRDTHFEPRTRKEISKIEWYKLSELPTLRKNKQDEGLAVANANKFYMVAPFLNQLKKWIAQQKRVGSNVQGAPANGGYVSTDENGLHANGSMMKALPSDLPEVTSGPDASSHLKRLLNIGALQTPESVQPAQPVQPTAVDQSKSNALLALLRQGSQDVIPRSPSVTAPPSAPPMTEAPHLAPNFFPGFPQQRQHMPLSNFMQQTSAQTMNNGPQNATMHPSTNTHQHFAFPVTNQLELSASPAVQQVPQTHSSGYQDHRSAPQANRPNLQSQGPAPFQQTGDPQFSQQARPPQTAGAIVPPASRLPPPKLNSHSLALLGFFKGDTSRSPSSQHVAANVAAPTQAPQPPRKTSHHQDSLLNLFKAQQNPSASTPQAVELSGNPVPVSSAPAPAEIQILQRGPQQRNHQSPRASNGARPGQTSATVSGPLNMPQFEAMPKHGPKKGPNGQNRKNANWREYQQPQSLASPITILPRPQSAKRNVTMPPMHVAQASHQPPVQQPQAPEPVKPFQPQILRRSEKADYEGLMAAGSSGSPAQVPATDLSPPTSFDRRPSQTNAQKEALLSLFGKSPASPSPASAEAQHDPGMAQHSAASGYVSPMSSRRFPSSGESLSRHGTPSEVDMVPNRIASPNNKAFLLGYLQGVAKGSK
ncbi:hypothetical protein N7540_001269 [Penicillium herquei]|nr:hypothetical protein N7540_001269 [Penicillium herquei]